MAQPGLYAWGVWHGILLSIEQAANLKPSRRWVQILQGLVTFHLVGIGWVLFRSDNFQAAGRFLVGMVRFQQMNSLALFLPPVIVTAVLVFILDGIGRYSAESKFNPKIR
jgi:D-alanyl-lipoteichoic acid acyltransferase DltB (MBOAT superfamily)